MNMRVDGLSSQYNGYKVNIDKINQKIEKQKESNSFIDEAEISAEGKKALENRTSALAGQRSRDGIRHLSSVSSYGYISDFEKALSDLGKGTVPGEYMTGNYEKEIADIAVRFEQEEGEKTDSFDCHVNKMVSAYNMMRDKIEAKYSDSEKEVEYYVANNGEIEELTKQKELEMLDKAYAHHSTFMATSTQIWADLQEFTPTIVQHKGATQAANEQDIDEDTTEDTEKGKIKDMVSQAFMSAISDENKISLSHQKGSLNHFKLNLSISSSARSILNGIWDYYANRT